MNSYDLNEIDQLNESRFLTEELNLQDQPTSQQVLQKAEQLQIDDLILARESLTKELDPQWKPYCNRQGQIYYINLIQQMAYLNHPVDMHFKKLYSKNNELPIPKFKSFRISEIAKSMDLIDTQIHSFMAQKHNTKLKTVYEESSEEEVMSSRVNLPMNFYESEQRVQLETRKSELNVEELHELHEYQKQLQQQYLQAFKKRKKQIECKIQERKKQHEQRVNRITNSQIFQRCEQYEEEVEHKNKLDMQKQKQKQEIEYQQKRMEYLENIYKFNRVFEQFREKQRGAQQIFQAKNASQRLMMIQAIKQKADFQKYKTLESLKNKIMQQFNQKIRQLMDRNKNCQEHQKLQSIFNQTRTKGLKQGFKTKNRSYKNEKLSLKKQQVEIHKLKRDIQYQQLKKEILGSSLWSNGIDNFHDNLKADHVNNHKPSLNLRLRMRII